MELTRAFLAGICAAVPAGPVLLLVLQKLLKFFGIARPCADGAQLKNPLWSHPVFDSQIHIAAQ